ncbi:phospholipase D-like domain-containing protein [Luteimonas notoginsengisoli]|uniref:phospholipase D n=1 Tax=Luteimonas notoginsengisoli TaxID=1578200 RepID=A0ABV7UUR2_9GAMM
MDFAALDRALRDSAQDLTLSGEEKAELRELGRQIDPARIRYLRNRGFDMVREIVAAQPGDALEALRWLEQVIKTLDAASQAAPTVSSAWFAPGEHCLRDLCGRMRAARRELDICVFTIADDRLSDEIIAAHRRGVRVRVVSDNDKQYDTGSDIARLVDHGVEVRLDAGPSHMHHKFALFDGCLLANGSFNWTRSATTHNDENLVVTDDPNLVRSFAQQFEVLWGHFA